MKMNQTKGIALFCLIVLLLSVCACAKKETAPAEEEIKFPIDTYNVQIPVYALVEEKTPAGSFSYDGFIFDRYGRILEKKVHGDSEGSYAYEYNEDGLLALATFTCEEGYEESEYEYNEIGQIYMQWDRSDFSEKNGNRYVYTYAFDELERIAKRTITNTRNDYSVRVCTYEYDDRSNPAHETQTDYGHGGYTVRAVYEKENTFNFNGDLVRTVSREQDAETEEISTYSYACVALRTIDSRNDENLQSASKWQRYEEAQDLIRPEDCDTSIRLSKKQEIDGGVQYIYELPGNEAEALERLHIYQAILRDHCDLTFLEEPDGSMSVFRKEKTIATLFTKRSPDGRLMLGVRFRK